MDAKKDLLIGPFSQVITMCGLPQHGPLGDHQLEIVENAGVVTHGDQILSVGAYDALLDSFPDADREIIEQPAVLLPGFIDCHTHICFAGSRAQDYALKLQGKSYLEIAREGGGIWRTVEYTRQATVNELTEGLIKRMNRHLSEGVTTVEVKTGYGLNVADELKMLAAIQNAAMVSTGTIIPTCLAAHIKPKDFEGTTGQYLEYLIRELLPPIKAANLCRRVDIFIEDGAFSPEESERYLAEAKEMGFDLTVHADQFSPGGAIIAARLGAVSADHLEASGNEDIKTLAESQTVAVVLPGASLGLGINFAPARKLLDAGCSLAIASDWNPGSAPMGDLLIQAALLSVFEKLSFAETMAGITFRAAMALGLADRGRILEGLRADMAAFPISDYREILYHQGKMKPFKVWVS